MTAKIVIRKTDGGYTAHSGTLLFKVASLRENRGELWGELCVRSLLAQHHDGIITSPETLFTGTVNLSTLPGRQGLARYLKESANGHGEDIRFIEHVERFAAGVIAQERAGEAFQLIGQLEPREAPTALLVPVLYVGLPTLVYARGGTGKTTIGIGIAASIETGRVIIPGWFPASPAHGLILDWEGDEDTTNAIIAKVARGIGIKPPQIAYRRMLRSLADDLEAVKAAVRERDARFVIVDSVGLATAGGQNGGDANESALRLYAALRELGIASLLIDHVAGEFLDVVGPTPKPYGSVYKTNLARYQFELRREKEGDPGRQELLVLDAKANYRAKLAPQGLTLVYEPGSIKFEHATIVAPELVRVLSKADQMARFLTEGPATGEAIATELDVSPGYVRALLSKDKRGRFERRDGGLIALASQG